MFDNPNPTPSELIAYAEKQLAFEYTESDERKTDLHKKEEDKKDLIKKKLRKKVLDDLVENLCKYTQNKFGQFWSNQATRSGKYPREHLRSFLEEFLKETGILKKYDTEEQTKNLMHEHLRVLVFLAALRYKAFPKPHMQKKFCPDVSTNEFCDIFLFENSSDKPAHAIQIRFLTHLELDLHNKIRGFTRRGKDQLSAGIENLEEFLEDSQISLNAYLYGRNLGPNSNSNTLSSVLVITPNQVDWVECDYYEEQVRIILPNQVKSTNPVKNSSNLKAQIPSRNEKEFHSNKNQQRLSHGNQNSQTKPQKITQNTQDSFPSIQKVDSGAQFQIEEEIGDSLSNSIFSDIPSREPSVSSERGLVQKLVVPKSINEACHSKGIKGSLPFVEYTVLKKTSNFENKIDSKHDAEQRKDIKNARKPGFKLT